jgi:hypothetical protein
MTRVGSTNCGACVRMMESHAGTENQERLPACHDQRRLHLIFNCGGVSDVHDLAIMTARTQLEAGKVVFVFEDLAQADFRCSFVVCSLAKIAKCKPCAKANPFVSPTYHAEPAKKIRLD